MQSILSLFGGLSTDYYAVTLTAGSSGRVLRSVASVFLLIFFLSWLTGFSSASESNPEEFSFVIVNQYPHDPKAFTQGLAWDQGVVFEGTGKRGRSSLRRVDLKTGRVERQIDYKKEIFAEGITVLKDRIYQLTWKSKIVFAYDLHDFTLIKSWRFPREGWGITHDTRSLIVSDGSSTLYFLDPETLTEKRRISVRDNFGPIRNINELEYINGAIYANVWQTDRIIIINPDSGLVTGWINLAGLRDHLITDKPLNVLNGIMYDPEGDRLFVTGKLWPILFEIRIVPDSKKTAGR